jgi:hypothetical protein
LIVPTTLILRPIPARDRHESAPILPSLVTITADRVTATVSDHPGVEYPSFAELVATHEVSAAELLGHDLHASAIRTLRAEAGSAGDSETVADCDRALDGDDQARNTIAEFILAARVAALD